jgi:integrase
MGARVIESSLNVARVRLAKGKLAPRARFYVATERRRKEVEAMGAALVSASVDPARIKAILTSAAKADDAELRGLQALVREVTAGDAKAKPRVQIGVTFRELAEDWVSGELHRKWPDHVKLKSSADKDEGRLDLLYKTIGDVRLEAFTLEDAERAMGKIDPKRSSATRRHYAQLISKVLRLAVYPCKIIERTPLPVGFLPKVKSNKATSYLFPTEDAAVLKHKPIPLERRAFWGFLTREGMREGEALALTWADVNLERGAITLDENKTDDPRAWVLNPGVAKALAKLKPEKAPDTARVFPNLHDGQRLPEQLRDDLEAAGVKRPELFKKSDKRRPVRVHDLRGTFVTLSLANGKTETWVQDRTGHKSSVMINRYRQAARTAAELGLGELAPLDCALPELAPKKGGPKGGPERRPAVRKTAKRSAKNSINSTSSPSRTRTGTTVRSEDFKSPAYAVPPRGLGAVGIASVGGAGPPKPALFDAQ